MAIATSSQDALLATLLVDLAIVAGSALALGALARRFGQAAVVGEIFAGLLLGPSLLGPLPGSLDTLLFPPEVRPYLQVLANVALVLFMFGIGFEVDIGGIRRAGRAVARIAWASVLVPVVAGFAIAPVLWAAHPPAEGVMGVQFATFVAVVLSVTALSVLARVLADARLSDTPLGTIALVVAAMTDLVSWLALAALTATLGATRGRMPIGTLALSLGAFVALLVLVVRPALRWGLAGPWYERHGPAGGSLLLLVALALCAAATTQMGMHPAFGALALGVACPRRCGSTAPGLARALGSGPRDPSAEPAVIAARTLSAAGLVLVPMYFIVTGLKVDVTSLGVNGLLEVAGLLVVAATAKIAGVAWAAARSDLGPGRSLALGVLLNTRGLTELIVLDIGRGAGVIDSQLFTVLVLVALLTTAMTLPLLPFALRIGKSTAERLAFHARAAEVSRG